MNETGTKKHRRKSSRLSAHGEIIHGISDDIDMDDIASEVTSSKMTEPHEERDQLVNPYWLEERWADILNLPQMHTPLSLD